MGPWTERLSRAQSGIELACNTVGNALVVHAAAGITPEARSLAMSLAADTDHDLVVADLPVDSPAGVWDALASALPRRRCGVRLMLARRSSELDPLAGHWLSERLGRTVVLSQGDLSRAEDGSLDVHYGADSGWMRFRPGRKPEWESRHFPRSAWDSRSPAELRQTGTGSVAEPLPAGVWIRSWGKEARLSPSRARLSRVLPCLPGTLLVVLGGRGVPQLPLEDVGRFWATLPEDDRPKVRFVQYGPVDLPRERTLGQALADLLESEVVCYNGIPVGSSDVFTLSSDGSHGWNTYGQQFSYQPRNGADAVSASPRLCGYRQPVAGLPEIAPGVYHCAPDAVLEIVQAGLWLRPPGEPEHAAAVRSVAADSATLVLRYESAGPEQADRMRCLAEEILSSLDYSTRLAVRLMSVTVSEGRSVSDPTAAATCPPAVSVPLPALGIDAERKSLRESGQSEFDLQAEADAVLTGSPEIFAGLLCSQEDILTDVIAVRLHLAGRGPDVDRGSRATEPGLRLAFRRCVAAGLIRFPSRAGRVHHADSLAVGLLRRVSGVYRMGLPRLTGFALLHRRRRRRFARLSDDRADDGTARTRESPTCGRVVFAPGTRFKVLELNKPQPGIRGRILFRELSPIGIDTETASHRASLEVERRSLGRHRT